MKLKQLFIILLFISFFASAQNEKGKFFVETGVKIFGGGEFINFVGQTGISYNHFNTKTESPFKTEFNYKGFTYSIAPRVGYFLSDYIIGGIESQYYKRNIYDLHLSYRIATAGIFFRYNFLERKILPFVEIQSGIGTSKSINESVSPGGGEYQQIQINTLYYLAGSAGITILLNQNFRMNLFAKIQNTSARFNDKSNFTSSDFKENNLEIGPMLSVSYIFKKKSKTQE